MSREITKNRINLTIDKKVDADLARFCKSIKMSKSAFVEHLIKDSLATTIQPFSSDESLSSAIVILSNQIQEIQKMMKDTSYLEQNRRLNEVKHELQNERYKMSE